MTRTIIMTAPTARTAMMIPAIVTRGRPSPPLESSIPLSAFEESEDTDSLRDESQDTEDL